MEKRNYSYRENNTLSYFHLDLWYCPFSSFWLCEKVNFPYLSRTFHITFSFSLFGLVAFPSGHQQTFHTYFRIQTSIVYGLALKCWQLDFGNLWSMTARTQQSSAIWSRISMDDIGYANCAIIQFHG